MSRSAGPECEALQRTAGRDVGPDRRPGRPTATVPSGLGDEAAGALVARRRDPRGEKTDAWLAQALTEHGGNFVDLTGPSSPARAHEALLAVLSRTGTAADEDALPFVRRLADADAAAVTALAAWLDGALASDASEGVPGEARRG
ncbi:hypothetical protein [Streptomyces sp. NPDC057428]|uniref:hypothetical protein n=1 Tax=Streptomyces sp. NPDC057428 TaxID=3346129 RepID=UPI0036A2CB8F